MNTTKNVYNSEVKRNTNAAGTFPTWWKADGKQPCEICGILATHAYGVIGTKVYHFCENPMCYGKLHVDPQYPFVYCQTICGLLGVNPILTKPPVTPVYHNGTFNYWYIVGDGIWSQKGALVQVCNGIETKIATLSDLDLWRRASHLLEQVIQRDCCEK